MHLKTKRVARDSAPVSDNIFGDERHELESLLVSSVLLQTVQQMINALTALHRTYKHLDINGMQKTGSNGADMTLHYIKVIQSG